MSAVAHERVKELCRGGHALAAVGDWSAALKLYWEAFDLIPEPKERSGVTTGILGVIGDVNFRAGDYEAGCDNLREAMRCPGAIGTPFFHLRLGQCQYELGDHVRAAEELARAFLLEGKKIFEGEEPKYLAFIKARLDPPPGGWPEGW